MTLFRRPSRTLDFNPELVIEISESFITNSQNEEEKMMRIQFWTGLLAILAMASTTFAGEPTFDGVWKLNPSKSKLAGQTFTISKGASGKMRFDMHGFAYDFDTSGKEFPTPDGGTVSVVEPQPNTQDITIRMNGKVIMNNRWVVKGDKATFTMKTPQETGAAVEQTSQFERVAGGPGVFGTWKSTDVQSTPMTIEIATKGQNGISMKYPEMKMRVDGMFDGKDHVVKMDDDAATKQTAVFEKTGPKSFKATTKIDGKPFFIENFSLSDDGNTLTDDANMANTNEPVKAVYDRQK